MQKYSYKMLKYLYALCMQKIVNKLQNFNTLFCHVYGRQNNCFWWHHWVSVFLWPCHSSGDLVVNYSIIINWANTHLWSFCCFLFLSSIRSYSSSNILISAPCLSCWLDRNLIQILSPCFLLLPTDRKILKRNLGWSEHEESI